MRGLTLILTLLTGLATAQSSAPEKLTVSDFAGAGLRDWEEERFSTPTHYELQRKHGTTLLKAESNASASGLYKKIRVDLHQTPYLNWQWQVDQSLPPRDEKRKEGDDYPARIYVIHEGRIPLLNSRAINYVWASAQPPESDWPNAYTDRSHMVAVRSGAQHTGRLLREKRNVREDFRHFHGRDVRYIDVVALMSDSDNSGLQTAAWYGEIYFSSH